MVKNLYALSIEALRDLKHLSFKRVLILCVFGFFILAVAFSVVLVNAGESVAYPPFNTNEYSGILESKGQHLDVLFKDRYSEISKRDKDLAYIFLRKKFKGKNVCFTLRKVKIGENLWGIAKEHGVNIDTIIGANPELKDLKARLNQQVVMLSRRGVIHEVVDREEDLDLLSRLYGISEEKIRKYNDIDSKIKIGDLLFIPGVKPVYMSDELKSLFNKRSMFRSPLSGVYTSLFGSRNNPVTGKKQMHGAVDIRAKMGTWVGAAADGAVTYAGWKGGLGYCVKIKHAEGYSSLYAHLSKIYVKPGQKVFAGKLIAKSGNSGRTTGPHLHFAIYKNGRAQNPLKYLW